MQSLAEEFDIVDIAAAAVQLAHVAVAGEGDEREIPSSTTPMRDRPGDNRPLKPSRGRVPGERQTGGESDMVRLFVGAGRRGGIRPGDLVGAITGESGLESRNIGAIEINDNFSLVEVPDDRADDVIAALKRTKLRGLKVTVRRER